MQRWPCNISYNAKLWWEKPSVNRLFKSFGKENIGEFKLYPFVNKVNLEFGWLMLFSPLLATAELYLNSSTHPQMVIGFSRVYRAPVMI